MTVRVAASFGATSRHVMWLCGAPCSSRIGGPEPPITPLISAPVVFTLKGLKPGKKLAAPADAACCARARPATSAPARQHRRPVECTSRRSIISGLPAAILTHPAAESKDLQLGSGATVGQAVSSLVRIGRRAAACASSNGRAVELEADGQPIAAALDESARAR